MTTKKKKFTELSKEEKTKVFKALLTSCVMALIAAAFVMNIFSCQIGPVAPATVVTENKTNWNRVVNNSTWTLVATNVTAPGLIPEVWYGFSSFHIDSAEQEEDKSSVHLVTVTKDNVETTAYLVLQEDGYGTLELSSECTLDVHIIKLSGSSNSDAGYLMRLSLDEQVIELMPAD